jgi:hypothetical protein
LLLALSAALPIPKILDLRYLSLLCLPI